VCEKYWMHIEVLTFTLFCGCSPGGPLLHPRLVSVLVHRDLAFGGSEIV
jgi:hypothetical protein